MVNQASLTGESMPVRKTPGARLCRARGGGGRMRHLRGAEGSGSGRYDQIVA